MTNTGMRGRYTLKDAKAIVDLDEIGFSSNKEALFKLGMTDHKDMEKPEELGPRHTPLILRFGITKVVTGFGSTIVQYLTASEKRSFAARYRDHRRSRGCARLAHARPRAPQINCGDLSIYPPPTALCCLC